MAESLTYAQKLADWKEAMKILPDERFLELLRVYLGEIKTPYNKEKLLDRLLVFLRDEKNLSAICGMLSSCDLKILSAIHFFDGATAREIFSFFSPSLSVFEFEARLQNLFERMLIFSVRIGCERVYFLAPAVEKKILPLLSHSRLVSVCGDSKSASPNFSTRFFAGLVSFAQNEKSLCKTTGELRKKAAERAAQVFASAFPSPMAGEKIVSFVETALAACKNLGLCVQDDAAINFDFSALDEFAKLPPDMIRAFLAASICGAVSRRGMIESAKAIFLLRQKYLGKRIFADEFFSAILFAARESDAGNSSRDIEALFDDGFANSEERLLQALECFDVARLADEGGKRFVEFPPADEAFCEDGAKLADVEANFDVNVFAGLSLQKSLRLAQFLSIKSCDYSSRYEISKASCVRAFLQGAQSGEIISFLNENSAHEVPPAVAYSINDWHKNFLSSALFAGYVIKVAEEKRGAFEKSRAYSALNPTKLAAGIYLVDFSDEVCDKDVVALCNEAGLDYVSEVQNRRNRAPLRKFSKFCAHPPRQDEKIAQDSSDEDSRAFIKKMLDSLEKTGLSLRQKSCAKIQILQKLVASESQFDAILPKVALNSQDYNLKMKILRAAAANGGAVELLLSGEKKCVAGKPFSFSRGADNIVTCRLRSLSDGAEKKFAVAQVIFVQAVPETACENLDLL